MSLPDLFRLAQVVFGIGLVIFVHEAGHFIAARMCGVRVDVFSLGFGPRLFGWRRGSTMYQVAAIPVGGYVRMAGEMPDASGRPPASDELHAKSVGQRFFIYSGGVIMNVVFALVVFPMVLAAGVPVLEPLISRPDKGLPAWREEIPAGTRILAVNGEEVFDFFHIPNAIALAGEGPVELTVLLPGASEPSTLEVEPEYSEEGGFQRIGVRPGVDPSLELLVDPDGPAAAAGLREGDVLLGVRGGLEGHDPVEQLDRAFLEGGPIGLRVRRGAQELELTVAPTEEPAPDGARRYFGIGPLVNRVAQWRPDPWLGRLGLEPGDRIVAVDGHPVAGAHDLLEALVSPAEEPGAGLNVRLERTDARGDLLGTRTARLEGRPSEAEATALEHDLYLDHDPECTLVEVQPDRAAFAAGMRTGDRVLAVGGVAVGGWKDIYEATRRAARRLDVVEVRYERRDAAGGWSAATAEVRPAPPPVKRYGFDLAPARGVYRTGGVGQSIHAGLGASWRFLTDTWMTLKKMALGRVSTENLGGIITIGTVSYSWASEGWAKLFFFLCMLSINLAFLNVLPIPLLDGGHLFFCLVEAVKGSPVSERTLGYSQLVGLVLILTLMVYVTYQDVMRILPGY